eukprot:s1184_g21.t1
MEEWDILRSPSQDLSNPEVVEELIRRIRNQEFDAIFMSPPCNTWSRAPHSNPWGPCPVRNRQWPRGFPWAEGKFKDYAHLGNVLVDVCFTICKVICDDPRCAAVKIIWEHPEDLGAAVDSKGRTVFPASIWQLPETEFLLSQPNWVTVAFFQCRFQVNRLKPTRLLSNIAGIADLGLVGPPQFDSAGWYVGPLPSTCSHGGHPSLIKKRQADDFHTTGTGVYPPLMDDALAAAIFSACHPTHSVEGAIMGGVTEEEENPGNSGTPGPGSTGEESPGKTGTVTPGNTGQEDPGDTGNRSSLEDFEDGKGHHNGVQERPGRMKACYKGRTRPFHDGLGLCSMGRWMSEARDGPTGDLAKHLKGIFWEEMERWLEARGKAFELKLIAQVLCGKLEEQPFEDLPDRIRRRWIQDLNAAGIPAARKDGDRKSIIGLRLLRALAIAVEDPDCEYLEEMAFQGVRLGTGGEVPRVPQVFEVKEKWALPEGRPEVWDEEQVQPNYKSAREHMEKVRQQIAKDVDKGLIVKMSLEAARKRYGSDLKVAALAAVPKDPTWDQVRVVHDATNGVEVNHQIRMVNRIRFPLFDDLEAAMHQFLKEADSRRLLMAFDYKGAHRLVPIHEDDWGKQAFRLEDEGEVLLNCVGTFGVASAAFWWARLAATLQRTMWAFLPFRDPIYLLLFADDGLCLASGPRYRKILLAILLFLTVLEAPLSWAKTRGGQQVEWLGYQIDVKAGLVGVSEKKVEWLRGWVDQVLAANGVLGREMKAALGRMGFLAGPLKHARPFLALLYKWTSKLGAGAFVEIPVSLRLLLRFFLESVTRNPLRPPKGIPRPGGEIFRVDAKAEGAMVVIGGWETYGGSSPAGCRWFSVRLTRKNAPWVFVKGEPFKVIASLELLAITVAIMVFGPEAKWKEVAGRLVLTAFTDNQANSYVLDKYMSTAFPLSVVLMELALHLQRNQVDLDLQWIPRDQNTEADALTNEEFEGFEESRRIHVEIERLDFIILQKLMGMAEEIDSEDTPLLEYEVWCGKEDSFCHGLAPADGRRTRTSRTVAKISGLAPGSEYIFRVRALNLSGWSPWSAPSEVVSTAYTMEAQSSEIMSAVYRHFGGVGAAFRAFDRDRDGFVSRNEFMLGLSKYRSSMEQRARLFDMASHEGGPAGLSYGDFASLFCRPTPTNTSKSPSRPESRPEASRSARVLNDLKEARRSRGRNVRKTSPPCLRERALQHSETVPLSCGKVCCDSPGSSPASQGKRDFQSVSDTEIELKDSHCDSARRHVDCQRITSERLPIADRRVRALSMY